MGRRWSLWILVLFLSTPISCDDNPTKPPPNRNPVITSLIAFPSAIGPGDSTIVICEAQDSDDEALSYDWVTDARLVIKGKQPDEHVLYSSSSNTQVFYHGVISPYDSAWVECDVHDSKGGTAVRQVKILVNQ